ncbi:MAG: glycosyl transferase family protein [Pseudomonadota bacterium]|nr:glycosyl transferase family protein [Pseudomonadota bacterium]
MTDDAHTALAPYVRILGRGPGRSRNLTREEAGEAMRLMLAGAVAPESVGALLMLMRFRGENPDEIAGFCDGARASLGAWRDLAPMIDWPSYAAGRSRGLPYFLLAARLCASAGRSVMLHGWNSAAHMRAAADLRAMLAPIGIPVADTPDAARAALDAGGICYVPLEIMSPDLYRLLRMRDLFGLRSAVNTTLRVMNPSGAATSVQGVFHPPYRPLQVSASMLLGQARQMALKGGGGEFERNPAKSVTLEGVTGGARFESEAAPLIDETRRLAEAEPDPADLPALWAGTRSDPFAEAIVTGTAAAALFAAGLFPDLKTAEAEAERLWAARPRALAA